MKILPSKVDHLLEAELQSLDAQMEQKANVDYQRMLDTAINIYVLLMRRSGHYDNHFSLEITEKLKKHISDVYDTHHNVGGKTFTIISGVINIASGVLSFVPIIGAARFAAETTKSIGKAAQGLSAAGSGFGGFTKLFDETSNGERTLHHFKVEEAKRSRDDQQFRSRQDETRIKDEVRRMQEAMQSKHQTFQQMASPAA